MLPNDPLPLLGSDDNDDSNESNTRAVLLLAKLGLALVPGGQFLSELLSFIHDETMAQREDTWRRELASGFADLQQWRKDVTAEMLAQKESFVTTLQQASEIARRTHQQEKLAALRNAVVNAALDNSPDDDLQAMFLSFVDGFTQWHLRLLRFFNTARSWTVTTTSGGDQMGMYRTTITPISDVMTEFPALAGREAFCEQCIADLVARGLMTLEPDKVTHFPASETDAPKRGFVQILGGPSWVTRLATHLGWRFLIFVTSPFNSKGLTSDAAKTGKAPTDAFQAED